MNTYSVLQEAEKISSRAIEKIPCNSPILMVVLLERYQAAFKNISLLISLMKAYESINYPLALTLRSLILDSIDVLYLYTIKKEDFKEEFQSIQSDHIEYYIFDIKLFSENEIYCKSEIDQIYNELEKEYPEFFHEGKIDRTKPKNSLRIKGKIKKGKKEKMDAIFNNSDIKQYIYVFAIYSYFSKWEHAGIMTYKMTRSPIDPDIVKKSIKVFLASLEILLGFLNVDNVLAKELEQIREIRLKAEI